jgi:hypothetical protein
MKQARTKAKRVPVAALLRTIDDKRLEYEGRWKEHQKASERDARAGRIEKAIMQRSMSRYHQGIFQGFLEAQALVQDFADGTEPFLGLRED